MNTAYAIGLVAGLRDQPRGGPLDEPYHAALEVLGLLGVPEAAPTLALALEKGVPAEATDSWIENTCRALQQHPATSPAMIRVSELPGFALAAASTRFRRMGPAVLRAWLCHDYWKARLKAASCRIKDGHDRARAICSVWHSIAAADIPVDEEPQPYGSPLRVPEGAPNWAELAEPYGGLIELPPPLGLADGARAACADLRAWCREKLAESGAAVSPDTGHPTGLVMSEERRAQVVAAEEKILARATMQLEEIAELLAKQQALGADE